MTTDHYTSRVDVIEESLDLDLNPANIPKLKQLKGEHLHKLARDLEEHTQAQYMKLPSGDGLRFVSHPNGPLTQALGGAGEGVDHLVKRHPEELFGECLTSLLYLPSVAIADGIQYSLDFFFYDPRADAPEFHASVLRSLEFYSLARPLIARESLILLPSSKWLDPIRAARKSGRFAVGGSDPRLPAAAAALASPDNLNYPTKAREETDLTRQLAAYHLKTLDELLSLCAATNYRPLLDIPEHSIITSGSTGGTLPAEKRNDRFGEILPWISRISADDFLRLRDSDAFEAFRAELEMACRDVRGASWESGDRNAHVELILKRARAQLMESLRKSDPTSRLFSSSKLAFFGAMVGFMITQNPMGALSGIATAVTKEVLELEQQRQERARQQLLTGVYASMLTPPLA